MKTRLIAALIITLIASVSSRGEETEKPVPEDGTKAHPYTVKAEVMLQEWKDNVIAAERKYKNKWVLVTGTVEAIGKTLGARYVALTGLSGFSGVNLYCTKAEDERIAQINKGDEITALGRVRDKTLGAIMIHDCELKKWPSQKQP